MNNSSNNQTAASGGIGFCGLLGIVFIVLKLIGVINWPWGLVLMPIWLPIAGGLIFLILYIVFLKWLTK